MRHLHGMGGVFRAIPSHALTVDQLEMPKAVRSFAALSNGLILVTGKTGSGKSTSLAAMIDDINRRIKGHILTVEDPIEFVHARPQLPHQPARDRGALPEFRRRVAFGPARGSRTSSWSASYATSRP